MHNVMTQVISHDWIIDALAITFVCQTTCQAECFGQRDEHTKHPKCSKRERSSGVAVRFISCNFWELSRILIRAFLTWFFTLSFHRKHGNWTQHFHRVGCFRLKWFGLISWNCGFSHMPRFSGVSISLAFPRPPTNISSLIPIFSPISTPQDRQMIVFSISLFISPHNLWIIFQHFSTSVLLEWIASHFTENFLT